MRSRIIILLITGTMITSCSVRDNDITGTWEATFSDSLVNPAQYFNIIKNDGVITLGIDEPGEDWYDIPGEKLYFINDSLYFERFWGLEKYSGKFTRSNGTFRGKKVLSDGSSFDFSMKRTRPGMLSYRIPGKGKDGKQVHSYHYAKPENRVTGIPSASLSETGIDSSYIIRLINRVLNGHIPGIHSLLIYKDGKLLLEEYFSGYSAERMHRVHSVTKSFTSALAGIAAGHGLLDINDPVLKYFPGRASAGWVRSKDAVRVEHLLSMTAGLDWKSLTPGESNDDIEMYRSKDFFTYLLNKNVIYEPGTHFCYNNGLSLILGHIIAKATGMPADSFARSTLFRELDINEYLWDRDPGGLRTDGGLKMKPVDMLKLGILFLNNGQWNGRQIVPAEWAALSTEPKIRSGDRDYAWHWWNKDYSINGKLFRTCFALGHGEQAVIIVPEQQLVFAMTAGNYFETEHRPFEIMSEYILPSLKHEDAGKNPDQQLFAGEYMLNDNESVIVSLRDGQLYATDPAGVALKLIPKSSYCCTTEDQQRVIHFIPAEDGNISCAEIFIKGQMTDRVMKK